MGAARHDRSTGVHRPLYGDVMAFAPQDAAGRNGSGRVVVQLQLDMVGLVPEVRQQIIDAVAAATGVAESDVVISFSHTHSGGVFHPDRASMPGGELIAPYLDATISKLAEAARQAVASLCLADAHRLGADRAAGADRQQSLTADADPQIASGDDTAVDHFDRAFIVQVKTYDGVLRDDGVGAIEEPQRAQSRVAADDQIGCGLRE